MFGQFDGLIEAAANMPQDGEAGTYTAEMFLADFPQFSKKKIVEEEPPEQPQEELPEEKPESLIPEPMLQIFILNANASILPGRYCEMWRYAAGLYVAHYSAMYLKTYADGTVSAAQAAAKGQQTGLVSEAVMGDTSIKYDNTAVVAAQAKWGNWNATQYGQQLITMARMIGMGGMYVI